MFKSSLRGYSDAYLTVKNTGIAAVPNSRKNITIKNCAPFTDCISELKKYTNRQCKRHYLVTPRYNLIEYSDNYSSGSLLQYYRDEPFLDDTMPLLVSLLIIIIKVLGWNLEQKDPAE